MNLVSMMARGTTSEECERALGMCHQTVSARRTDLRAAGYTTYLLDAPGIRVRRPTSSGSGAFVEIATQRGKDAIARGLPLHFKNADPTAPRHGGNPSSAAAYGRTNRYGDARRILEYMIKFS